MSRAPREAPPEAVPAVSFVIPQKGRLDLLETTLRSIAAQRSDATNPPSLEVIVVTQDDDPEEVRRLMRDAFAGVEALRHRCVDAHALGSIAALRNEGARLARGETLAFLDADIELSANWVAALTDELAADERRVLVSAVQVGAARAGPIERLQVELSGMKADAEVGFLSGHDLLVRRHAFDRAGGFPEHLQTCEDSVFTDRVGRAGVLYLSSRATYVHLGEDPDHATLFRKEIWRGRSNLASLDGRRPRAAELPSFVVPPTIVLGIVAVPFVASLGGFPPVLVPLSLVVAPPFAWTLRLYLAAEGRLGLFEVLAYYSVYFPARGIGMLLGSTDRWRSRAGARS